MNFDFTSRLKKIEAVLEKNLPENPVSAVWLEKTFGNIPQAVQPCHTEELTRPCKNLLSSGGKRWRPLLMVLCTEAACAGAADKAEMIERAYDLTPLVEFVHTASLIHDDIEDGADMRRGKAAAHITWGTDTAINAASWLYFQAAACLSNVMPVLKTLLYDALLLELRRLHLGQAMDIAWHKNHRSLPSVDEYLAMTSLKTGTLASLACRCGILIGGGTSTQAEKAAGCAASIGVGFQIRDDIINLTIGNTGKKRGDDIVEGKKSLPLLYHLQENPADFEKFAAYFRQAAEEGVDSPAVEKALAVLNAGGAVRRAEKQSKKLIEESCARLCSIYPDTEGSMLIEKLFAGM